MVNVMTIDPLMFEPSKIEEQRMSKINRIGWSISCWPPVRPRCGCWTTWSAVGGTTCR
jgi:hypothetical protein